MTPKVQEIFESDIRYTISDTAKAVCISNVRNIFARQIDIAYTQMTENVHNYKPLWGIAKKMFLNSI